MMGRDRRQPPVTWRASALARSITGIAVVVVCAVALSGCFVIPLTDGRSPFDDPFGASHRDIESLYPAVQEQLDKIDTGGEWLLTPYTEYDTCEGICNLRLGISLMPTEQLRLKVKQAGAAEPPDDEEFYVEPVPVPTDLLVQTLESAVPIAVDAGVDITVQGGYNFGLEDDFDVQGNVTEAAQSILGTTEERVAVDGVYTFWGGEEGSLISLYTSETPDALERA